MTVYVDPPIHRYGRMIMCHMWADSLAELIAMADAIGVARRWLQEPPKASWVHFDVCKAKRAEAIARGAIETDLYGPLEHVANLNGNDALLARIARLREMKNGDPQCRSKTSAG